ncbi:Delta(14)-sterol reductase [Seminavis robusta]|uniref:Delta(14)-sterol reductase ERG24 n=1 Tax=Seminavis robusta TaxID=568900 RepID=A0A9N8I0T8_9STRA|nr:Delta(14)-sterol reductase [Seminavis robusta]|eukprot:Sro2884_g339330.1 Delta(14)-sterol reductase (459) ;mRNA; f:5174-6694
MTSSTSDKKKKADSFEYEFGGPIGAFFTVTLLPIVVLLLSHWSKIGGLDAGFLADFRTESFWDAWLKSSVLCPSCSTSGDRANDLLLFRCAGGILCYFIFQVLLERWLPCELVQGMPVKGNPNHRLTYRINGHLAFWVTLLALDVGWPTWHESSQSYQFGRAPLAVLYDYHAELALVTILFCFALSFYLYTTSFQGQRILADGGNSGNPVYDFFLGRELNPRIGSFDWKEFCELRPGLIGWAILNLAFMAKQHENLGYVTGSMILINIFQFIYVWDGIYQEKAILSTMDITTDGFGYMLCFGDLAWVPFTYSIQARYLVNNDPHLSYAALAAIVATHIVGYATFRGANSQKDAFRKDPNHPNVVHLQFMKTKRGTKLLTSGWWGMARKINYTGDYIMGLSWCLVCGFDSIVPYFYAIYFAILLVHRAIRDDHACQEKYGEDWKEYKKKVPYMFIPGIV